MIKHIAFIIILFFSVQLTAQKNVDYSSPKEYTIKDITLSGSRFADKSTLIQISGLTIGEKIMIPGTQITDAVKKLWKQKMFSDIKINIVSIEGSEITLDFFVLEQPRLSQINYHGIKKYKHDDINDIIDLTRGTRVTEDVIQKAKNRIKEYYGEKGYSRTNVLIQKKQDTAFQNAVILDVYIKKNKKTKIEEINIEGNTVFSKNKIKWFKLKETKNKRWYGLFKPSKYVPENYEDDKKNLIAEYNKKGYRDAKIVKDSVYNDGEDNVSIYIKIDEGKQYYFRNIKWIGNTKYKTEILESKLRIKKGDVFNKEKLNQRLNTDEDAVGNLYTDNGYLFFFVRPVETKIESDSVDIELLIYEGQKAKIGRVIISGNDRTNDHVIRREIRTYPGDWFSKSAIIRSVRELAQLGHFDPEQIVPTPIPNQSDGTVDIHYSLVERGNDRVELSGGYGGNMLIGSLGLSFNNFSIHNFFDKESWRPLPTGDGQTFSIRAQTRGTIQQYYSLTFVEPWLGGKKPNSLSVSAYYSRQSYAYTNEAANLQNIQVLGASTGIGQRLKWPDDFFTRYVELGYQKYILTNWNIFRDLSNGSFNNLTLKLVLGRNSVDNPIYSRSGSSFTFGVETTPIPFSLFNGKDYTTMTDEEKFKWLEYHKWTFKSSWFSRLVHDLVLNTRVEFGVLGYFNKDVGHSPFGGYSLGGSGMSYYSYGTDIVGLRGYEDGSLTPSSGGNMYAKYIVELRYPAVLSQSAQIYGLIFADAGNAWTEYRDFNPYKTYRSLGVGARIFLPMLGLIGLDWGYGFDTLPGASSPSGGQFHFTMGQQF